MLTTVTDEWQVTIPKSIRDELDLKPGAMIEFFLNSNREIVLRVPDEAGKSWRPSTGDRFDAVRGKADVKWQTGELKKILRSAD